MQNKWLITEEQADTRLDRFLTRHCAGLTNGMIQKAVRQKKILLNGKKVAANTRLMVRDLLVCLLETTPAPKKSFPVSEKDAQFIQNLVIYKDEDILILNKPAGLAVQGGSKTTRHIDGMLDALKYEKAERPCLVHRLDKETSGVLVLGRTKKATAMLTKGFASRQIHKIYWALVEGVPAYDKGRIDAPLLKKNTANQQEQMVVDYERGQSATSLYRVVDTAQKVSWLELMPLTGRTHQLRVHCALMQTPIVGDEKYNTEPKELSFTEKKMYLHAAGIKIPRIGKETLEIYAKMPHYMEDSFKFLGFHNNLKINAFDFFKEGIK